MTNKRFKIFLWSLSGVIGVFIVSPIVGNYVASQQERQIEQKIEKFTKQFPQHEPNDSTLKLRLLTAKLGISYGTDSLNSTMSKYTDFHSDFQIDKKSQQDYQNIDKKLTEYLSQQIAKPNDQIDKIPAELEQYLSSKAKLIEDINKHLINHDIPDLGIDLTSTLTGDPSIASPSFLSMVNLQKILALDILQKQGKGQTKEALEALEASWKYNQSLQKQPLLIAQLVAIIMGRYYLGVIRKLDNVSPQWQQRLLIHDYRQSMGKSLENEFVLQFNLVNKWLLKSDTATLSAFDISIGGENNDWIERLFIQSPPGKLYFRFSAIDTYTNEMQALNNSPKQNICLAQSADVGIDNNTAWWNILGQIAMPSYLAQETKASRYMLDLELTQKILQIKEIAAKEGKLPQFVPKMESNICPGVQWIYQVSPDGKATISLSQVPNWLNDQSQKSGSVPLSYTFDKISSNR